ncbi:MAG: putative porin [Campylobacterota bacterium]|nr:putative porin [Campylobacterota bacterium]
MKTLVYLFILGYIGLLGADDSNETVSSRLEDGYGNSEMLSDSMPYLPKTKKGESVQFLGDLRLRSQTINRSSEEDFEHIFRFRARFGLNAKLTDDLKLELMLASGSGDPVSTNQSLGGAWVGKNVIIDIADIYYNYDYHSFIRGGKMKLPIYRTHKNQLIFDGDLRPEGAFVKHKLLENSDVTLGAFVLANLDETEDAESIYFYTAQFIQHIEDFRFTLGYHYYDSLKGRKPTILYNTGTIKGVSKGNTLDADEKYAYDYHIAELALQYDFENFSIGFDTAYNTAISEENFGYNLSLFYGKLKHNGDFKLGYFYRDIQKDAVVGALNDSDFMGGGTDGYGHQLMGGYQLAKNTQLALTYIDTIVNQKEEDENFRRLHLDIKFVFKSE